MYSDLSPRPCCLEEGWAGIFDLFSGEEDNLLFSLFELDNSCEGLSRKRGRRRLPSLFRRRLPSLFRVLIFGSASFLSFLIP